MSDLLNAVSTYHTAMNLYQRHGNEFGDKDAMEKAWKVCEKAAEDLSSLKQNDDRVWNEAVERVIFVMQNQHSITNKAIIDVRRLKR